MLVVATAVAVGVGVALSNGSGSDSRDQPSTFVEATMKLPMTKSDFNEAAQTKFRAGARSSPCNCSDTRRSLTKCAVAHAGVAKAASTDVEDVKIKNIAEVTSRRTLTFHGRRAVRSIVVDFSIAVTSAEVASALAQSLRFLSSCDACARVNTDAYVRVRASCHTWELELLVPWL